MGIYDVWLRAKNSLSTVFKSNKKPTINATGNQPNSINTLLWPVNLSESELRELSKKVIVHVKTNDIQSAKVNYKRDSSIFTNYINPVPWNTHLPVEDGLEFSTDEIALQIGNWIHIITPYELFTVLHGQFANKMESRQ